MNENTYTSQQAQKLRSQADLFSVSQIGQTIVVSSLKNQLWVEWQMDGTVEIGVGLNTKKKLSTIQLYLSVARVIRQPCQGAVWQLQWGGI